jgi:transposase-like protein
MAKKGQTFKKVILEERLSAVKECIEEGKIYSYVANKYGVSRGTVSTWVRIYKRDNGFLL